ncbi:MAG: hypothetical protein ABFD89_21005 [Bryobacteraceae bacterium]
MPVDHPLRPIRSMADKARQAPGGNLTLNYRNGMRSNATHESLVDRFARLFKKTREADAKLCYLGHLVTENRNGLVVDTRLTLATGTAKREAAIAISEQMAERHKQGTLAADRAYDTHATCAGCAL